MGFFWIENRMRKVESVGVVLRVFSCIEGLVGGSKFWEGLVYKEK